MASTSAPAPSSSKQDRAAQPSSPPAIVDKFSPTFNDPEADVILRTADGWLFATKRMYLMVASSVFEDMFKLPQLYQPSGGVTKAGQAAPGVLPVVEMAETRAHLEPFLRWIHRDTFDSLFYSLSEQDLDHEDMCRTLVALLACATKYDATAMFTPLDLLLESLLAWDATFILALAAAYHRVILACTAIRAWTAQLISNWPKMGGDVRTQRFQVDRTPPSVSTIWPELARLLPVGFFLEIARVEHAIFFDPKHKTEDLCDAFVTALDSDFPLDDCELFNHSAWS